MSKGEGDLLTLNSGLGIVNNGAFQNVVSPGAFNNSFPFTRLAAIPASGSVFIYHQINASTLVEEILDTSLNSLGQSNNIIIPSN